jgi:HEAT repeat protein
VTTQSGVRSARCEVRGATCDVRRAVVRRAVVRRAVVRRAVVRRAVVRRAVVRRAVRRAALGAAALGAVLGAGAPTASAQGRVTNAKTETHAVAQSLDREVQSIAARGAAAWLAYRLPMVAGPRQMCCWDTIGDGDACCGRCRLEGGGGISMNTGDQQSRNGSRVVLEPATEFVVFVRVESGSVGRIRTFTPDCDIDGGGMPIVWLENVKPDDSVAWLTGLVTGAPDTGERHDHVAKPAMTAIALTNAPSADRALEDFVAPSRPEWLRGETAFWIGNSRGEPGARILARMMAQDPSDKVRDKVAFALSVNKTPAALATLVAAAKDDKSPRVRGQALFWLAQKAGQQAVATITGAIDNDPETEVKKKAVFALSQLPKDEGVPRLIQVARTNKNAEVRKQAMFWLGQSKDPRAVQFFEDILTKR